MSVSNLIRYIRRSLQRMADERFFRDYFFFQILQGIHISRHLAHGHFKSQLVEWFTQDYGIDNDEDSAIGLGAAILKM